MAAAKTKFDLNDLPTIKNMMQSCNENFDGVKYLLDGNYTLVQVCNTVLDFLNFDTVSTTIENLIQAADYLGAINEYTVSKFQKFLNPQKHDLPGWSEIYRHRGCEKVKFAAENGHIICLQLCIKNKSTMDKNAVNGATKNGHLACLKHLVENNCPMNNEAIHHAVENGQMECLEYLVENNCPIDSYAAEIAAKNGNAKCLEYLIDNNCPLTANAMCRAIEHGHFECLEYLVANNCPMDNAMLCAVEYRQVKCLNYMLKNCPIDKSTINYLKKVVGKK